jgi:hypothetical protein
MSGGHSSAKFPEQSEGGTASIAGAKHPENLKKTSAVIRLISSCILHRFFPSARIKGLASPLHACHAR